MEVLPFTRKNRVDQRRNVLRVSLSCLNNQDYSKCRIKNLLREIRIGRICRNV